MKIAARIQGLCAAVDRRGHNGIDKLRKFVRKALRPLATRQVVCLHSTLAAELGALTAEAQQRLKLSYATMANSFQKFIEQGIDDGSITCADPELAAATLTATAQGSLQMARVRGIEYFDKIMKQAIQWLAT